MRPNPLPLVIGLSALLNTLNHSGHQANTKAAPTDGLNWTGQKGAELESSPNYPLLAPVVEIVPFSLPNSPSLMPLTFMTSSGDLNGPFALR